MIQRYVVNDIKNFVFGLIEAFVYGFDKRRKQKFVMSFTIITGFLCRADRGYRASTGIYTFSLAVNAKSWTEPISIS